MTYKGYTADIKFDSEANTFFGIILNSSAVIHFRGKSVEELEKSFQEGVDEYLTICEEEGIIPERPFSGEFRVRISPELHKKVFLQSKRAKLSINKFAIQAFEEKLLKSNIENVVSDIDKSFFQEIMQDLKGNMISTNDSSVETENSPEALQRNTTNNVIDFPLAN